MNVRVIIGAVLVLASCWPVYLGLAALAERDYLATGLALGLAWVLARTGVELLAQHDKAQEAVRARSSGDRHIDAG